MGLRLARRTRAFLSLCPGAPGDQHAVGERDRGRAVADTVAGAHRGVLREGSRRHRQGLKRRYLLASSDSDSAGRRLCDKFVGRPEAQAERGGTSMRTTHAGVLTVVALADIAIVGGCGQNNSYVAPPPPKVTVASPIQQPITRYLELTGSAAAVNTANLVARVPGFVHEINYQDGAIVKKDTLLFTIEPELYEVKLKQAQAAEAGAEASLKQAQTEFDRQAKLVTTRTATQAAYDQALANRDAANANYLQAQANSRLAALNDEYAHVKAPFDGVVTARQVSVGEFVGGSATPTVL